MNSSVTRFDHQKLVVKTFLGSLRRRCLGLRPEETSFARRGFRGTNLELRAGLERAAATFVAGYHAALEHGAPTAVTDELQRLEADLCGFGFEGAAMGLALRDRLSPWRARCIPEFLRGVGDAHAYMIHVGIGWVWARLPIGFRREQRKLDPLLGWLAFDGWGFHDGFFRWHNFAPNHLAPRRLVDYERRAFDQGFGRSFWFSHGGDVELIARTIATFAPDRRADLWSGVGLAATYAGGASEAALRLLRESAGLHRAPLAQGAAFAAKARERGGNRTPYTELAANILCGLSAPGAARLTDATLENLPTDTAAPAYEIWRQRIQNHFASTRQLRAA